MRGRTMFCALFLLGSPLFAAFAAFAGSAPAALAPRIANGLPTQAFPSVGWLLIQSRFGIGYCSGTLIGCHTFLTAAHCICTDSSGNILSGAECQNRPSLLDPTGKTVFLQNAGNLSVASIAVDPSFQFGVDGDFAILRLAAAVTGVAPSPINTTARPAAGTAGTLAGFGLTGGNTFDVGIKRTGQVVTSTCPASLVPSSTNLCWIYQNPLGAPGSNSDTCGGDSGGPLFVDLGLGPVLAGSTSGGDSDCVPTDNSFDADVFVDRDWITATAGADLGSASCGLPAAGAPGSTVVTGSGTVSPAAPSTLFTVDVPPSTATLRVTLNTEANTDADLFLKLGSTATPGNFDCRSINAGTPDACEIFSPGPGTWSILVDRASSGTGAFQMTATYYATIPSPSLQFHTLPPCRLVDTRSPAGPLGGPALLANSVRNFPLTGVCGVPSDAKALSVNLSVTQPGAIGFLRLYPGDLPSAPVSSAINFQAGQTRANNAILALPADPGAGTNVRVDSAGTVHFILDVNGYFR
ncbi:MAG: hypothetical protein QOJ16_2403 [Acidobacteriota bacterium]|nr:hypothetical protein [Acidobacteriota bacterium]